MASHRLSETYRQKIQASSLGYGGKPKKDQAETVVTTQPHLDAAAGPNNERVLRQFDLTAKYGPCTDVTRKQRWERAQKLGLNPPEAVKLIIEQLETSHPGQQGIWANRI